jgi:hypothetical protein
MANTTDLSVTIVSWNNPVVEAFSAIDFDRSTPECGAVNLPPVRLRLLEEEPNAAPHVEDSIGLPIALEPAKHLAIAEARDR